MTHHLLLTIAIASMATPALPQATPATKGPQAVSRTVFMSRIDKAFGELDANKDGYASKAEIETAEARAIEARKARALKQREASFRRMDKDKNGSVSLQEFHAAMEALPERKPDATARLNRLDSNKDGRISMIEHRGPAAAQFERLDSNKDGILSVDEQKAGRRRR